MLMLIMCVLLRNPPSQCVQRTTAASPGGSAVQLPPIPGPYPGKRTLLNPFPQPQIPVNPAQVAC